MLLFLLALAHADIPEEAPLPPTERHVTSTAVPFLWGVRLFQVAVSPGDGPRCPLTPSCSAYARQALRRDGPLGLPLVFDRLLREGSERSHGEVVVLASGKAVYKDPLDAHASPLDLFVADRELPGLRASRARTDRPAD